MNKFIKIFSILLIIPFYCISQNSNYTINYELTRSIGQFSFKADGILEVDSKNKISNFKLSQYKNLLKEGENVYNSELKKDGIVLGANNICYENQIYYHNYIKDSIYSILIDRYCKNKVLIKDTILYPKWEIKNEFKKIGNYNTQKATAFIRDRIWTVYFTNEVGINGGPWMLIGLPGLVLEANSVFKKEYINELAQYTVTVSYEFRLAKINKSNEYLKITKPYYKYQLPFNEFVKKAIKRKTDEVYFRLSKIGDVNKKDFPLYETLDFIEKRD